MFLKVKIKIHKIPKHPPQYKPSSPQILLDLEVRMVMLLLVNQQVFAESMCPKARTFHRPP